MNKKLKVLFAGESILEARTVYKGFDKLNSSWYIEKKRYFMEACEKNSIGVDHIPTPRVGEEFPWTIEELRKYDAIVISDIGSNTFLVSQRTFWYGLKTPNRLKLLEEYVSSGGGFIMFGGYMSYTGQGGKGFYKDTAIEKLLPVNLMSTDDRREVPEGFLPVINIEGHPVLSGMPDKWEGWFLFYNRLIPKKGAEVVASIEEYDNDPFLTLWNYGKGRAIAVAVDCAQHGTPDSFLEWKYCNTFFSNLVKWVTKTI